MTTLPSFLAASRFTGCAQTTGAVTKNAAIAHEVSTDLDLISLLEAGLGVALVPRSTQSPATLLRIAVTDIDLTRTIHLYGVAGRQRTAVASAMMKMLRAYDWSRYGTSLG